MAPTLQSCMPAVHTPSVNVPKQCVIADIPFSCVNPNRSPYCEKCFPKQCKDRDMLLQRLEQNQTVYTFLRPPL